MANGTCVGMADAPRGGAVARLDTGGCVVRGITGISTVREATICLFPIGREQLTIVSLTLASSDLGRPAPGPQPDPHLLVDGPGDVVKVLPYDEAARMLETATSCFPTTRPIDPNGAAAESGTDESDTEAGGGDKIVQARWIMVPGDEAADAGVRVQDDSADAPAGYTRFVLAVTPDKDGGGEWWCRVTFGLIHERVVPDLSSLYCEPSSLVASFLDGLTIITASTTRASGGKDPSETSKDLRKRLATGAVNRMVMPKAEVADVFTQLGENPLTMCATTLDASLRKKHSLSVYLNRPMLFALNDVGAD